MSNLKMVQNLLVGGQNKTVKQALEMKYIKFENGWKTEGDTVIFWSSPAVKRVDSILNSTIDYKWKVEGNKITAIGGRTVELTPDLHEGHSKITQRRKAVPKDELEIYDYIAKVYGDQEDDNEYEITFQIVSKHYGLTSNEVEEIYFKVNEMLYGKNE